MSEGERVRLTSLRPAPAERARWGRRPWRRFCAPRRDVRRGTVPRSAPGPRGARRRTRLAARRRARDRPDGGLLPAGRGRPVHFGAIAAANAMSDLYAMGRAAVRAESRRLPGRPRPSVLSEILAAGREGARAGPWCGWPHHRDEEPKYGLAVTGIVHPTGSSRRPARGRGTPCSSPSPSDRRRDHRAQARQGRRGGSRGRDREHGAALEGAKRLLCEAGDAVHALTDVTGFALAATPRDGRAVRRRAPLRFRNVPLLPAPSGTRERDGPAARGRTRSTTAPGSSTAHARDLGAPSAFRPQTSGGLLRPWTERRPRHHRGLRRRGRAGLADREVVDGSREPDRRVDQPSPSPSSSCAASVRTR